MRRFTLFCALLALTLPGASAARSGAPGDGTILVRNANVKIVVQAKGGLIGRCAKCVVTIRDPIADDGSGPIVSGAEATHDLNDTTTRYFGTDVRFRIIGGRFTVTVNGFGIDVSAIGKGQVWVAGKGTADDGSFSLNGAAPQPIIDFLTLQLSSPTG